MSDDGSNDSSLFMRLKSVGQIIIFVLFASFVIGLGIYISFQIIAIQPDFKVSKCGVDCVGLEVEGDGVRSINNNTFVVNETEDTFNLGNTDDVTVDVKGGNSLEEMVVTNGKKLKFVFEDYDHNTLTVVDANNREVVAEFSKEDGDWRKRGQ